MKIGRILIALISISISYFQITDVSIAQRIVGEELPRSSRAELLPPISSAEIQAEEIASEENDEEISVSLLVGSDPVLTRKLFYNNSSFDVVDDANAMAMNKVALKEGGTATLQNYSSYSLGINGIFIDVTDLPGNVTLADFEFRVGNNNNPDQWVTAPDPTSVSVVQNVGVNGSDRIKLIWADGAIVKKWLRIKLSANANTGLPQDDIFYFGNVIGETGDNPNDAVVSLVDAAATRNNLTSFTPAGISNPYDFNRDDQVQLDDYSIVRNNLSSFTPLNLVSPLSGKALPAGLGRGVNFGNMLEAPNEGDWGFFVQSIFFDKVVEAELEHIRLPISWTNHALATAPYTINETFFQRVDWCVAQAKSRGLKIIVNVHHYDQLNDNPTAETPRALALWSQIANRYKNEPNTVFFEILNEPHGMFNTNPTLWNLYMANALNVIRATNPTRKVLVGPVFWNSIGALDTFIPPNDPNLIATIHFYDPFSFTHQGATWVNPVPPVGVPWFGTRRGFGGGWQSWSWGTTFSSTDSGLRVTYDSGWAGLRFHATSLATGANKLVFTTNGSANLSVWLIDPNGNQTSNVAIQTGSGVNTHTINFNQFGYSGAVRDVVFQHTTANPGPTLTFQSVQLCGTNVNYSLIESEAEAVRGAFRAAAKWSLENNIPMHLGEFGAYGLADLPSRARWTTEVRATCESLNLNWSYWEMVAGFGFYDPPTNAWNLPLLQALNPQFGN